jgi:hypothetical protein
MTAQINDTVFHRKIEFSVAGKDGSGLFDPRSHGISPAGVSSACWRGYHLAYSVRNDQLLLGKVFLSLCTADALRASAGKGPELFGKLPKKHNSLWQEWIYDLQQPIPFSGGLLLGDSFIRELYVHMGFHPAWKYRNVRELLFEDGRLTDEFDRSAEMEEARKKHLQQPFQPTSGEQIREWVGQCFSRNYTRHS